jgi:signal transduction histidine kinase
VHSFDITTFKLSTYLFKRREEKGHHIGLVLCKDLVEQNKGKIWFESAVGVGTTFFIELPKNKI